MKIAATISALTLFSGAAFAENGEFKLVNETPFAALYRDGYEQIAGR